MDIVEMLNDRRRVKEITVSYKKRQAEFYSVLVAQVRDRQEIKNLLRSLGEVTIDFVRCGYLNIKSFI